MPRSMLRRVLACSLVLLAGACSAGAELLLTPQAPPLLLTPQTQSGALLLPTEQAMWTVTFFSPAGEMLSAHTVAEGQPLPAPPDWRPEGADAVSWLLPGEDAPLYLPGAPAASDVTVHATVHWAPVQEALLPVYREAVQAVQPLPSAGFVPDSILLPAPVPVPASADAAQLVATQILVPTHAQRRAEILVDAPSSPQTGDTIVLRAVLHGYGAEGAACQWQVNRDGIWMDVPGARGLTHAFTLDDETGRCAWRVAVTPAS